MERLREARVFRREPTKLDVRADKGQDIAKAGRESNAQLPLDLDKFRLRCWRSENKRTRIEALVRQSFEDEMKAALKMHGGVLDA